jgi:hypothetical protein
MNIQTPEDNIRFLEKQVHLRNSENAELIHKIFVLRGELSKAHDLLGAAEATITSLKKEIATNVDQS